MKKHISYPKIQQFRNVVSAINRLITYVGQDENDEPIYDSSIKKPILTFTGTVKIHGTNAGVSYNIENGLWAQSRKNIITVENDNAGFAFFVEKNKTIFQRMIDSIIEEHHINVDVYTISIYGEWAGKGIQKGVGISQLEKALYIFGVKISKLGDVDFKSYWLDSTKLSDVDSRIFNVNDFQTYNIDVDFNMPKLAQNKLIEITDNVGDECPVANHFGVKGVGEGVVWKIDYKGDVHRFKVKDDRHSVTKVKKIASVDVEKLNSVNEFIEYSVTENRFNQAIENVFGNNDLDIKKMGDLIRWVVKDITSEEMDTMVENNLEPKDVNKYISTKVREMFFIALSEF